MSALYDELGAVAGTAVTKERHEGLRLMAQRAIDASLELADELKAA